MLVVGSPMLGAQATSRTQSLCSFSTASHSQPGPWLGSVVFGFQIFTRPSQPPDTRRGGATLGAPPLCTRAAGLVEGAQLTANTPGVCASNRSTRHSFGDSVRWLSTEMEPSEEPHASMRPYSQGAQTSELTDSSCTLCSYTRTHELVPSFSRQIITLRSYEHEASTEPNLGCAHATCQTGPSWLVQVVLVSKHALDALLIRLTQPIQLFV